MAVVPADVATLGEGAIACCGVLELGQLLLLLLLTVIDDVVSVWVFVGCLWVASVVGEDGCQMPMRLSTSLIPLRDVVLSKLEMV